jgi:hypothetical protein
MMEGPLGILLATGMHESAGAVDAVVVNAVVVIVAHMSIDRSSVTDGRRTGMSGVTCCGHRRSISRIT